MIGFYTAAKDNGGPTRSKAGVAIEPYGRVPFSQTQSLRTASSKPYRKNRTFFFSIFIKLFFFYYYSEANLVIVGVLMNMRDMKISEGYN